MCNERNAWALVTQALLMKASVQLLNRWKKLEEDARRAWVLRGEELRAATERMLLDLEKETGSPLPRAQMRDALVGHLEALSRPPVPDTVDQAEAADDCEAVERAGARPSPPVTGVEQPDEVCEGAFAYAQETVTRATLPIEQSYPTLLAGPYSDFNRQDHPLAAFLRLIDLFESVLKFLASIVLADCLSISVGSEQLRELVAKSIGRPSLGHWNGFLREALASFRDDDGALFVPELYEFYFLRTRKKKLQSTGSQKTINYLITLRNSVAHGATPSAESSRDFVAELQPRIDVLLDELSFLRRYALVVPRRPGDAAGHWVCTVHMGSIHEEEVLIEGEVQPGQVYLAASKRRAALMLSPFIIEAICEVCGEPKLFFYDSQKSKSSVFLEYLQGHRHNTDTPTREIARLCGYEPVQEVFKQKVDHSSFVQEGVRFFGGRSDLLREVESFFQGFSGAIVLRGEAGVGKTSILCALLEKREQAIVHIPSLSATGHLPEGLLTNLRLQALEAADLPVSEAPATFDGLSRLFFSNLTRAAAGLKTKSRPLVIVVDEPEKLALPAGLSLAQLLCPGGVPPENVVIVVAARPDFETGFENAEVIEISEPSHQDVSEIVQKIATVFDLDSDVATALGELENLTLTHAQTLVARIQAGRATKQDLLRLTDSFLEEALDELIDDEDFGREVRDVLGVLLTSGRMVDERLLGELTGRRGIQIAAALSRLRGYLRSEDDQFGERFALPSGPVEEWARSRLRDEIGHWHVRLADEYSPWRENLSIHTFAHLPRHLMAAGRMADFVRLFADGFHLEKLRSGALLAEVLDDIKHAIAAARSCGEFNLALRLSATHRVLKNAGTSALPLSLALSGRPIKGAVALNLADLDELIEGLDLHTAILAQTKPESLSPFVNAVLQSVTEDERELLWDDWLRRKHLLRSLLRTVEATPDSVRGLLETAKPPAAVADEVVEAAAQKLFTGAPDDAQEAAKLVPVRRWSVVGILAKNDERFGQRAGGGQDS